MRLRLLLSVWLVCGSMAAGQDSVKSNIRFFNDSAKAVDFWIEGQFGCSVPANPEENNAYCNAEISMGEHKLSVKGPKLALQSCELYVGKWGAEGHLSKGERFHCIQITTVD